MPADRDYLLRRIEQEADAAEAANCPGARTALQQLGIAFERRLRTLRGRAASRDDFVSAKLWRVRA
ncbi:hypothetical protein [Sphingomonas sp. DBB INV C78]|uniref:hypothetical protein n=1 Tax=Sphingomonas sp. DBB INV C78 TaxID=3349434 RepID=UPI0036D36693